MKPTPLGRGILASLALLALAQHSRGDSDEDAKGAPGSGPHEMPAAIFKDDHGLQFSPETAEAIGLHTAAAKIMPLSPELRITAQVFQTGPAALASAPITAAQASAVAGASVAGGRVERIDRGGENATGQAEVIVALDGRHAVGDFVVITFKGASSAVLAVPRGAILDSATGKFVYLASGGFYLRTAVKTGASNHEFVAVTEGLKSGDVIVTAPVQTLWLTELRLTMAGGDSD